MQKTSVECRKSDYGHLLAVFTFLLIITIGFFWCIQKQGMFLDEVYSYGLSNSEYKPFVTTLHDGGLTESVYTDDELLDYVTVSGGQRFDWASVYYNQTQDVHPPLYYFLLHAVCSFFPGSFSKWLGLSLNLVLFAMTLGLLYSMARFVFKSNRAALLTCLLYGTGTGAISMLVMIRMYMLLSLLSVLLAWLIVKHAERPSAWIYPAIAGTVFAGMMTQYLYAVYAFFVCAAYGIYLLCRRRRRQAFYFGLSAIFGVLSMLVCFPSWWMQLHSQETVSLNTVTSNMVGGLAFYVNRIKQGVLNVDNSLPMLDWLVILVLALWPAAGDPKKIIRGFPVPLAVLSVGSVLACVVLAIISPYIDPRYLSNVLPILAMMFVGFFLNVTRGLSPKIERYLQIAISAVAVYYALSVTPSYIYPSYSAVDKELSNLQDSSCVYVTPNNNPSFTSYLPQLLYFDDVCAVESTDSPLMRAYLEEKDAETMALFVAQYPEEQDDDAILACLLSGYGYHLDKQIESENGFTHLYILQRDMESQEG